MRHRVDMHFQNALIEATYTTKNLNNIIHYRISRLHGLGMKTISGSTAGAEIDNEASNQARMLLRILFRND